VPNVRIFPATPTHLEAFLRDPLELSALLRSPLPDSWPEFPEAIPHSLAVLRERPGELDWWMHLFVDVESGALVGSGGFAGEPQDGQVEIGYEIAPAFRRRGYGTAAARALVVKAFATGRVRSVIAHTLAGDERSAGVLRACGFEVIERVLHPEDGELVRWQHVQRAKRPDVPLGGDE
jgi:ribosomal-protein-alanine N-acetyltransferase